MAIQSTFLSDVVVCTILSRHMNMSNSPAIRDSLLQVVAAGQHRMIIDMRHVERVDSSGIVALLAVLRGTGSDGDLVIASMTDTANEIFQLAKMNHVFKIAHDPHSAVSMIKN